MKKFLTAVALVGVLATPAFAATHKAKPVARSDAWSAFAMAPSSQSKYSASLNGGGSIGYNQTEAQDLLNR